jgi:WD40 repeat protein
MLESCPRVVAGKSLILDIDVQQAQLMDCFIQHSVLSDSQLNIILHNANHLVTAFYKPMSCGALHVYYSALPFTPHSTALFQTYQHELHCSLHVCIGHEEDWSTCLHAIECCDHSCDNMKIAVLNDGAQIAVVCNYFLANLLSALCVWDLTTGVYLAMCIQPTVRLSMQSLNFSSNGACITVLGSNNISTIWDSEMCLLLLTLENCSSVALSRHNNLLVSGSPDSVVQVWEVQAGAVVIKLCGHTLEVCTVAFLHDSMCVGSVGCDRGVQVWDISTGVSNKVVTLPVGFHHHNFLNNGSWIASVSGNNIQVWDLSMGIELLLLQGHTKLVELVTFSDNRKQIISISWDHTIRVWDSSTGSELLKLEYHGHHVTCIAFCGDSTQAVSGSNVGVIQIWDCLTDSNSLQMELNL